MERASHVRSAELQRAFAAAEEGTDVHKLGVAMGLQQLLISDKLGRYGETLEEVDPGARHELGPRKSQIEQVISRLGAKPAVQTVMAQARRKGLTLALGGNYTGRIVEHANFIVSDQNQRTLEGLSDKRRGEMLTEQMAILTALDPELAQRTALQLLGREVGNNPEKVLASRPPAVVEGAVYRVLVLVDEMLEQPGAAQSALGVADTTTQGLKTSAAIQDVLAASKTRRVLSKALGKKFMNRGIFSRLGDPGGAESFARELDAQGEAAAAIQVRRYSSVGVFGRFVASLAALVALASLVESFPPIDQNGRVRWGELTEMTGGALATFSTAPAVLKFFGEDAGRLAAKILGREWKPATGGAAARLSKLADMRWLKTTGEILGPVADAILLPFAVQEFFEEIDNGDVVGSVTSFVGVLMAAGGLFALLLFTGPALAIVAVVFAVISLVALFVNIWFGESKLTGEIKQDLRYLGITGDEGYTYWKYATKDGKALPKSAVRRNMRGASKFDKVRLINRFMDGNTDRSEERLIFDILKDTPYERGEFLFLMEAIDTKRLAYELEDNTQAFVVLSWTLTAYEKAGQPPGRAFNEFIDEIAKAHRYPVIDAIVKDLDDAQFHKIAPDTIARCVNRLMDGTTNNAEERCIYKLLKKTSYRQFNAIMQQGGLKFAKRLRSELESDQWRSVRHWMTDVGENKSTPWVNHLAVQLGR